jgi:hypothetical protein
MEEDRMPKNIFTQEPEGMRRRGRPRKGWREEVERDLQVLGVRRWRELVIDRENCRGIVRQAKVHSGLFANGRKRRSITSRPSSPPRSTHLLILSVKGLKRPGREAYHCVFMAETGITLPLR